MSNSCIVCTKEKNLTTPSTLIQFHFEQLCGIRWKDGYVCDTCEQQYRNELQKPNGDMTEYIYHLNSLETSENLYHTIGKEKLKRLQDQFDVMDEDSDGVVNFAQFSVFFRKKLAEHSEDDQITSSELNDQIEGFWEGMDSDNDGEITFMEWVDALSSQAYHPQSEKNETNSKNNKDEEDDTVHSEIYCDKDNDDISALSNEEKITKLLELKKELSDTIIVNTRLRKRLDQVIVDHNHLEDENTTLSNRLNTQETQYKQLLYDREELKDKLSLSSNQSVEFQQVRGQLHVQLTEEKEKNQRLTSSLATSEKEKNDYFEELCKIKESRQSSEKKKANNMAERFVFPSFKRDQIDQPGYFLEKSWEKSIKNARK